MKHKNESLFLRIIEYVNQYFDVHGKAPSTREISESTNCSRATIQRYLNDLKNQGRIEYDGHRGIITDYMRSKSKDGVRVPLVGSIPCGGFNFSISGETEVLYFPYSLIGEGDYFLLKASGDSMIDVGINDGDLVLIKVQNEVSQGQIAAFLFDNETTLKRFYLENGNIILHPENKEKCDIVLSGNEKSRLSIQGIAKMVIKKL